MSRELNGAETLAGFVGWLTSLAIPVTFSGRHDATIAVELMRKFAAMNNIGEIGPEWPEGFCMPSIGFDPSSHAHEYTDTAG